MSGFKITLLLYTTFNAIKRQLLIIHQFIVVTNQVLVLSVGQTRAGPRNSFPACPDPGPDPDPGPGPCSRKE